MGLDEILKPQPDQPLPPDFTKLIQEFLRGRSAETLRVYGAAIDAFGDFAGVGTRSDATRKLLSLPHGQANALVLEYRHDLEEHHLSPATINLRLSALRSLVKLARTVGLINWSLEVQTVEARPYRDTRGPGEGGYIALLHACRGKWAIRDRAVLTLLYTSALRRGEVARLDLEDVDIEGSRLNVLGKKRKQKEWVSLAGGTKKALAAWMKIRGGAPGPLFHRHDGQRLEGSAIYRMVVRCGRRARVKARPHGLRHAAITTALDKTGGDVRAVRVFARLRKLDTVVVYDDARRDVGKEIAEKLDQGAEDRS